MRYGHRLGWWTMRRRQEESGVVRTYQEVALADPKPHAKRKTGETLPSRTFAIATAFEVKYPSVQRSLKTTR
jgi:hypothetical protein